MVSHPPLPLDAGLGHAAGFNQWDASQQEGSGVGSKRCVFLLPLLLLRTYPVCPAENEVRGAAAPSSAASPVEKPAHNTENLICELKKCLL